MNLYTNVDSVIELLGDKIIHTSQGSFIRVDDLREIEQQVRESKAAEAQAPRPKTFAEAREMAKRDPEMMTLLEPPRAPALSGAKGVTAEEENNEAA